MNTWPPRAGRSAPGWPFRYPAPPGCSFSPNRSWPHCFWAAKFNLAGCGNGGALSLQAYALGLPGLVGIKTLVPSFFARQDMKTPVKVAVLALACKFAVTLPLVGYWVVQGLNAPHALLAGGTALAATINAAAVAAVCEPGSRGQAGRDVQAAAADRGGGGPDFDAADRICAAAALWPEVSRMVRVLWIMACVGGAAAAYFLCLFLTGHRWRDTI